MMKSTTGIVLLLAEVFILAVGQQPAAKEGPPIPDKVALEIRTQQLTMMRMSQEFQSLQKQIDESPVGKRMKELQTQYEAAAKKLVDTSKGLCGDDKLWVLDLDAMKCVPPPKETATKKP